MIYCPINRDLESFIELKELISKAQIFKYIKSQMLLGPGAGITRSALRKQK
tara:strand:- start:1656 stop:1808 length:153 start_codon:yes stop_codon:yes gene_type:complete